MSLFACIIQLYITIDPPYNTGKDFVYKDNFKDNIQNYLEQTGQVDDEGRKMSTNAESNGRFHTDWLNMMYPRLKLARNLLTDDGVIFISIDERELSNLKRVCDEIFYEENFVELFVWTKTSTPPSLSFKSRKTVEYILCYEKVKNDNKYKGELLDNGDAPLLNTGNPSNILTFPSGSIKFNIPDGVYHPGEYDKVEVMNELFVENGTNKNIVQIKGEFKWIQSRVDSEIMSGTYFLIKSNKFSIRFQRVDNKGSYKSPTNFINKRQMEIELNSNIGVGTNESASKELKSLGLGGIFDYPKPVGLLKYLVKAITHENDVVLDFFSGSATTAHATIQLNAEDDGNRKYIMVQLPEGLEEKSKAYKEGYHSISDIGKERIRRIGDRILEEHPDARDLDTGFKVLKLDKSNIREWNVDFENIETDLFEDVFVEGRTELDIVYEIMLKNGLELTYPMNTFQVDEKNIYDIGVGNLFICLDNNINQSIAKKIIEKRNEYGIETSTVVFKDSGFNGNDSEKLNCMELLKDAGFHADHLMTI